jgi:hypothetical protein
MACLVAGRPLSSHVRSHHRAVYPRRSAQVPSNWDAERGVGDLLASITFLSFLAFPLVGALIASRRPHNPIGWICLADGLLWMLIVT